MTGKDSPWLDNIPKVDAILAEAIRELNKEQSFEEKLRTKKLTPSQASQILETRCYQIYLRYQEQVMREYSKKFDRAKIEMSLGQSRVTRAGDTVERILDYLLTRLGIPCERKVSYPKRNGEALDLVVPSADTLRKEPTRAVIISVKREVRERWREIVGEAYILREIHKIPDNIWFITLTGDISDYIVSSMVALKIRVYVPDQFYPQFKALGAKSISQMFDDLLEFVELYRSRNPSLGRWTN